MPPDAPAAEQPAATNGADFGLDADEQALYESMKTSGPAMGEPGFVGPEMPPEPTDPAIPAVTPGSEPAIAAAIPAAEPADDSDDDDAEPAALPDGTKPPKRVSYNKLRRAEEALAARDAELRAEREKAGKSAETQARLDERLRLINEALTTQPAPVVDDDPEPDPEADIFGHNAWLRRQQVKMQTAFDERIAQIETGQQTGQAEQQLASTYMDDAQRFAQTEPNFGAAYVYLMQVRVAQLASFHFGKDLTDPATPQLTSQELAKIKSEVAREEKQLVGTAIKNGKSPAAEVFRMAKMTGYRPQAPAVPTNGAAPPNGPAASGSAAAPAATPANGAAKPSVKAVIDGIKNGQEAALSLSNAGGAPAPVLDAKKLADMPEEEFGALLDQMSRGELRRVMGGA